ncbi:MAG: hypothetical protein P1V81_10175 [Planctomycetota bacterium]|nr:hypothetical protein [Planctomycetota bacterium]
MQDPADQSAAEAANEAALSSLDQIRNILTGDQQRDAKQRFKSIEERLGKETEALRKDMRERLSKLAAKVEADHAALKSELAKASKQGEARDDALAERIERLSDELSTDLREGLDALRLELNARCDALGTALSELSARSVPRTELADLFQDLAARIAPPAQGDSAKAS